MTQVLMAVRIAHLALRRNPLRSTLTMLGVIIGVAAVMAMLAIGQGAEEESARVMPSCWGSIASITLLVGGIGIMNIMLVSVTERTREIGIRLAVGAKQHDILWQFLVEALTLSLSGGVVDVGVGLAGSQLLSTTAGWPSLISWGAVALALTFSGAVGVFFGFYPARKAAQLDPIQALRYE
jgi:putative ABC transport system permease protein